MEQFVKCVHANGDLFTTGKMYKVTDNGLTSNDGYTFKSFMYGHEYKNGTCADAINAWFKGHYRFKPAKRNGNDKIIITTDGEKVVTATQYKNNKVVNRAEAKCAPEDKFDFNVGATLAVERLTKKEEPPKPKYYSGKVVCVKSNDRYFTKGKVYEIKDGKFTDNTGTERPCVSKYVRNLSDLNEGYFEKWMYHFIPFVES